MNSKKKPVPKMNSRGTGVTIHRDNRTWLKEHRRWFQIGGLVIRVDSDLRFEKETFNPNTCKFSVEDPGHYDISVHHHFFLPDLQDRNFGPQISGTNLFRIYRKNETSIYIHLLYPGSPFENPGLVRVAGFFKKAHSRIHVYHQGDAWFREGGLDSLFMVGSDQLTLSTVLADHQGCYLHSCGLILDGNGLVFAGRSGAGKSTIAKMFKSQAELLCDDRNIIRHWPEGFRVHGTWSHGEVPEVSAASAPLRAFFFLEKDSRNVLVPITNKKDLFFRLMQNLVVPVATSPWWNRILDLFDELTDRVPFYVFRFDKSRKAVDLIREFCDSQKP